jgi:predicted HicB family RNase H-like nuclease
VTLVASVCQRNALYSNGIKWSTRLAGGDFLSDIPAMRPAPQKREQPIRFRCTPEQHERWLAAADAAQRTLSDWMRLALDRQASAELEGDKGKKR